MPRYPKHQPTKNTPPKTSSFNISVASLQNPIMEKWYFTFKISSLHMIHDPKLDILVIWDFRKQHLNQKSPSSSWAIVASSWEFNSFTSSMSRWTERKMRSRSSTPWSHTISLPHIWRSKFWQFTILSWLSRSEFFWAYLYSVLECLFWHQGIELRWMASLNQPWGLVDVQHISRTGYEL